MDSDVPLKKCHKRVPVRQYCHYNKYIHYYELRTSSTELNDMFTEFVDYVDSFYGQNDPIYPMMSQETKQPLTKYDILRATENYLSMCSDKTNKFCTWGDGDSLDRERVRDILLDDYNYKFVGE